MVRACSLSFFALLLTAYSVYVNGASIGNDGLNEIKSSPSARQGKPTKSTTKTPLPNQMTLIATSSNNAINEPREFYHPAAVTKPRLIERYDKRSLDGQYEYRYVLSNGDVRYERAYWLPVGNQKILARKGYFSYPMPNHRFHTVFYTADDMGFREDESSISRMQPLLPRSLEMSNGSGNNAAFVGADSVALLKQEQKQVQTNKINRKPNWTPTTKSILQKGRIIAIASQDNGKAATRAATSSGRASATASSSTNRPQINREKVLKRNSGAKAISVPSAMTTATAVAMEQPSVAKSETINPIKAESLQTTAAAMETEAVELATVDTTATVLSVD